MAEIGFIGLGLMGLPMAGHLRNAGHTLHVYARSKSPTELAALGFNACVNPCEVAQRSGIVITMVSDTPDVEQVLFGTHGVAEGLKRGSLVIDMSSISPVATKAFALRIAQLGCDYVDAPVSGGDIGAKAATLTIMVGGTEAAFARALPLFEKLGTTITLIGGVGAGQTAKVANQIIVALTIEAVAEALLFASKAGVDPEKVRQALLGGFASSRVLEVHAKRMIERAFNPGFRMALHLKDLNIALDSARQLQLSLPNTASCAQLMNAACAGGLGQRDNTALMQVLEGLACHEMASTQVAGAGAAKV
jgi:2-hydroxy-3-oxopropionate reductase